MLAGLPKYSGKVLRNRGWSPKLQVYNTALLAAQAGLAPAAARADFSTGAKETAKWTS